MEDRCPRNRNRCCTSRRLNVLDVDEVADESDTANNNETGSVVVVVVARIEDSEERVVARVV